MPCPVVVSVSPSHKDKNLVTFISVHPRYALSCSGLSESVPQRYKFKIRVILFQFLTTVIGNGSCLISQHVNYSFIYMIKSILKHKLLMLFNVQIRLMLNRSLKCLGRPIRPM